ncbi:MAG: hypothetical protein IKT47_00155 [Oscillospiraceae bacterium]|nr:hypothetical protein [Oscillospiraceae bacterium]
MNLLANPTEIVQEVGLKTFRMFTVLSNMFVGITAAMSIPFAVDGIRQKNYHLPRWIVNLTLVSVTCISLTFVITLFILSPQAGFVLMMATRSNLFLHTIVPLLAILSFLFINVYHTVKVKTTFYALLPVFAYAVIYLISAIAIGEANGGWRDHYHFQELMPWYFLFVIIMILTFGLSNLLRVVHNRVHRRDKAALETYYQTAVEYDLPTIEEVIAKIAAESKGNDAGGEVVVPRRIINILEKKYKSGKDLSYLCGVYLEEYLK